MANRHHSTSTEKFHNVLKDFLNRRSPLTITLNFLTVVPSCQIFADYSWWIVNLRSNRWIHGWLFVYIGAVSLLAFCVFKSFSAVFSWRGWEGDKIWSLLEWPFCAVCIHFRSWGSYVYFLRSWRFSRLKAIWKPVLPSLPDLGIAEGGMYPEPIPGASFLQIAFLSLWEAISSEKHEVQSLIREQKGR